MHSLARTLTLLALLVLVLTSIVAPPSALAQTVRSSLPAPASGYCCSPSQVANAEALLPVRPVNPQAAVRFVTHLKLVNFQVVASRGNGSVHRPSGYNTIQYFFGYIPPTTGNLFVRPRPRFVVVTEIVEQRRPSGISITTELSGVQTTPIPAGYFSPLVLVTPVPNRHLTIAIESNIPRNRLHLLGKLLLVKAKAGSIVQPFRGTAIPCSHGGTPASVTIQRITLPRHHFTFVTGPTASSRRQTAIKRLYATACALSPAPRSNLPTSCGFSIDITYHVVFYQNGRRLFGTIASLGGCPADMYVGPQLGQGTPFFYGRVFFQYWREVAQTLGLQRLQLYPSCHVNPLTGGC